MIPDDQMAVYLQMPTPQLEAELLRWRRDLEAWQAWAETDEDLAYVREAQQIVTVIKGELRKRGAL
jgi:hypothetical protein